VSDNPSAMFGQDALGVAIWPVAPVDEIDNHAWLTLITPHCARRGSLALISRTGFAMIFQTES
jgi:hypothetical protein